MVRADSPVWSLRRSRLPGNRGCPGTAPEPLQMTNDFGKLIQRPPDTTQILGVRDDHLDAEHAFAFAIDLQNQLAIVNLEDRQVIGRSLDHDSPAGSILYTSSAMGPVTIAEDGFDPIQIERNSAPVDERLEDLLHLPAGFKPQVAAVLDLVGRELVVKTAAFLFV